MREILFRGKRMDNGEWVSSGNIIRFNPENDENLVFIPALNEPCRCVHDENDNIEAFEKGIFYKVDHNTVGQFTGLTDKNGKKIFEGDIVKCRHRAVKFYRDDTEAINPRRSYGKEIEENDGYGYSCIYWRNYAVEIRDGVVRIKNGSDHHEIRTNYIYNHAIEVIGNIHDNPELLEG